MILQMFQVYDSKAKAYLPPFFLASAGLAIRAITDCVADPKHNFSKYSEDFSLHHTASWDDQDGTIDQLDHPINLGLCSSFKPVVNLQQPQAEEKPNALSDATILPHAASGNSKKHIRP